MWVLKRAEPVIVALVIVSMATGVLWLIRQSASSDQHPVFFYLLPVALVAMVYGRWPAVLGVVVATACADYFLYEPLYSMDIVTWEEFGDLACFALVALFGVKCATELLRPPRTPPKSRYGA
jgi:K+-sensing histidine kinase KdpD